LSAACRRKKLISWLCGFYLLGSTSKMIDNNNISIGSNNITMNEIQKPHTNKASFDLHLASTENVRRFTEKSKENNVRE
jgi:hypothetical protein